MATYKPNSIYALTPMDSSKLGIWEVPEVIITGNETTTTISRHHRNRPDLLSNELYGTPQLWCIFKNCLKYFILWGTFKKYNC